MATTVSYKGQVLVTVDNSTKVLETSGTWCEDDFTLVDVSGGGGYTIDDFIERSNVTGDIVYSGSVTEFPRGAFAQTNITSFSSSVITGSNASDGGGGYEFYMCKNLKSVSLPNFANATNNQSGFMFAGCTELENVYLPKFTRSAGNPFQSCKKLKMLVLPSVNYTLGNYFANQCTLLETVDLGPNISGNLCGGNGFSDTALSTLILRRTADIVTLGNQNNFTNSPLASNGTGGDIYVPNALLSTYQSATNWSALNATWHAIEGSIYETKYADGTVIS